MAKLTRKQAQLHRQACDLLEKENLTFDEKWFVLEHWNEGANHVNGSAGAFFTPVELAADFRLEVSGDTVIDLCAGIGTLAFMYYHLPHHDTPPQITCIDINPAYVEVGKKILPEATWICGDVHEVAPTLGRFHCAISNPPFGRTVKASAGHGYTGAEFEYSVIALASKIADFGSFILPQQSAGFVYSGARYYERRNPQKYKRFAEDTGIHLDAGCGIDTTVHRDGWKTAAPACEVVCCEFDEPEAPAVVPLPAMRRGPLNTEQLSLF